MAERTTITRVELAVCLAEGAAAQAAGKPVLDCPYSPAGDANERMRAAAWVRAWVRARAAG